MGTGSVDVVLHIHIPTSRITWHLGKEKDGNVTICFLNKEQIWKIANIPFYPSVCLILVFCMRTSVLNFMCFPALNYNVTSFFPYYFIYVPI